MNHQLSRRELEVLGYLFTGKTNKDIAQIMGIGALTVKNHVLHVIRRMDAENRGHAVYLALCRGMLHVPVPDEPTPVPHNPAPIPMVVPPITDWFRLGNIALSEHSYQVRINDVQIQMHGRKMFDLLALFLHAPNRILTKDHAVNVLWPDSEWGVSALGVFITRLRALLKESGASHVITTERGVGYRMAEHIIPINWGGIKYTMKEINEAP